MPWKTVSTQLYIITNRMHFLTPCITRNAKASPPAMLQGNAAGEPALLYYKTKNLPANAERFTII
jgi:hypothetical protein